MNSTSVIAYLQNIKNILGAFTLLNLNGYHWPKPDPVKHLDTFDFIVVGAGTAGCVITNRLIELGHVSVLLIEAGGNPPFESEIPSLFPYLKGTGNDWNFTSSCDNQMSAHKNNIVEMTQGKMIGGSGSLNYMGYERGNKHDFNNWAKLSNDTVWSWESVLPTFLKNEKLIDKKMLNSTYSYFYGTDGNIKVSKQYFENNIDYFEAFKELGWDSPLDINPENPLGFTNVMFNIGDDQRQSTARKFLSPIKNDPNLYVMTNTLATKVIFDDSKRAIGVEVITNDDKVLTLRANIEVIVSAGAIKSPQLLMLSGIGPEYHLKSKGINVISNLPVGQNFQDHVNTYLVYKMTNSNKTTIVEDPHKYPFPIFDGYVALNSSQKYPDYEIFGASFGNPELFFGLCQFYFQLNSEFCSEITEEIGSSELLYAFLTQLYPKSRGKILLGSKNPLDNPIIISGYFTHNDDVINQAKYVQDFNRVLETSYFRNVKAKLVLPKLKNCKGLKEDTEEYWKCYTVGMSDTAFYYVGACGMGSVLDSKLRVLGVKNLRVIDASSFPDTIGATTFATVVMVAQKGVEFIINEHFHKSNDV